MKLKLLCPVLFSILIGGMLTIILVQQLFHKKYQRFVVTIPSYNNSQWYRYNLSSVFSQDYPYYRVIYIDDASTDNTYELVKEFIQKHNLQHRITLLRNKKNHGALYNHYRMIHMCDDNEIIVNLDGDDWFANTHVLSRLNEIYQNKNVWLTYAQFTNWPTNVPGWAVPIPPDIAFKNQFREYGFVCCGLRSYRAWLAKKIKLADLISPVAPCAGHFYSTVSDFALMFPMLEMAGERVRFISKISLIRNVATQLNDFKLRRKEQKYLGNFLRWQPKYTRLKCARSQILQSPQDVSLIIFSTSHAQKLKILLKSVRKYVRGISEIFVIGNTAITIKNFKPITFIKQGPHDDVYKIIIQTINQCREKFIMFGLESHVFIRPTDLTACTHALHTTKAFAFFLGNPTSRHPGKLPPLQKCDKKIRVFRPILGSDIWQQPFDFNMTVYKKKDVLSWLLCTDHFKFYLLGNTQKMNDVSQFERNLQKSLSVKKTAFTNVGLCFNQTKAHIP